MIRHLAFDCSRPAELAWFGLTAAPLRRPVGLSGCRDATGPHLEFLYRAAPKQVKNRIHFDLSPADRTRDAEVERLQELGAEVLADRRNADGTGWVVMADPQGNEFCVERSPAECSPAERQE